MMISIHKGAWINRNNITSIIEEDLQVQINLVGHESHIVEFESDDKLQSFLKELIGDHKSWQ